MKNLKFKLGLFSLLAVLAVSVFLTSCEQENLSPEVSLTQDDIVAKMQNDPDVLNLFAQTEEVRTMFLDKAIENNITADVIMQSMEDGTYNEILKTMGIDITEYQQSMNKIQQLSQSVLNKYPSIETCESCEETSKQEQLAAFQTMLDGAYLRGDCSSFWSWDTAKYTACVATCGLTTAGVGYFACSFVCYLSFCT